MCLRELRRLRIFSAGHATGTKDGASDGVNDGASEGIIEGRSEGTMEGKSEPAMELASLNSVADLFFIAVIGATTATTTRHNATGTIIRDRRLQAIVDSFL